MSSIETQILELFRKLTPAEKEAFAALARSLKPACGAAPVALTGKRGKKTAPGTANTRDGGVKKVMEIAYFTSNSTTETGVLQG